MKVALIGLGRWGKVLQGELEKVVEIKHRCDSKYNLEEVWKDAEVPAAFIATPTETHFAIASAALEAGKHVFLEKPGTTSSSDLEKLVQLARAKGVKFAVDYEFVHHEAAKKLKELLKPSDIKQAEFEWQKWGTFKDDTVHHLLCHDISVLKALGWAEITPMNHKRMKVISDTDIIDTSFNRAHSLINRASPIKQKTVSIFTADGGYIWSNDELLKINIGAQSLDKVGLPDGTPVGNSIKDFLNSIQENREPYTNGEFALEVFKVLENVK